MGGIFNSDGPDKENYQPFNIDQDLKSRYLGIIDKYMKDKGMVEAIPEESRPYELRDAQERGDWRTATGNQVNSQGGIQQPSLNEGLYFNRQPPENTSMSGAGERSGGQDNNPRLKSSLEAPSNTERAVSSQMLGIMPVATSKQGQAVPLTTNTAFFQEDERRKQEEFNKIKDYVYRDSRR